MVFANLPIIFSLGVTIILDIFTNTMAKKNVNNDSNSGFIITQEEIQRREKIPKRATKINIGLMVLALVCIVIANMTFVMGEEAKVLLIVVVLSLAKALCNPLITRFAFQVNQQIQQKTVEDRRQQEIEEALKKRDERRKAREEQNQENQIQTLPGSSSSIQNLTGVTDPPKREAPEMPHVNI